MRTLKDVTLITAPEVRSSDSQAVLCDITRRVAEALRKDRSNAIIATGGETFDAILECLNVDEFSLDGEFEPGFPFGTVDLRKSQTLVVGLKAGGFGGENALADAVRLLARHTELEKSAS